MGVVDDILDRMGEILDELGETIVENVIGTLAKIFISGSTLVASTPGLILASIFNNRIGYIDPLLLSPVHCSISLLEFDSHISTVQCYNASLTNLVDQGIDCSVVDLKRNSTILGMDGILCSVQEDIYVV